MSAQKLMLVLGATGFLGRFVVDRMLQCNYPIRVVTRGGADWQKSTVSTLRHKGVDVVIGDLSDEKTVAKACEGTSAIINMAGSFRESGNVSFEDLHVKTTEWLVHYGTEAGAQRFIHVSCLGAHGDSDSRYFYTKWEGEEIVRNSKMYSTIFRPSFLFGNRFPLLDYLKPVFTFKLFLPVVGGGTNSVQPVFVEDVADCVVQSIYAKETVGQSFDLVGPDDYQMLELLQSVRESLDIGGPTMPLPSQISGKTMDVLSKALPRSYLTNDLVAILSEDACGDQEEMLANFKVQNVSLQKYFDQIVDSLAAK